MSDNEQEMTSAEVITLSPIATPLAGEKLTKKLLKLVKKSAKAKYIKRGVKEVVKSVKSGKSKGLVIIAGDISPIDVISHLPVLCEDNDIPYIYVPSKAELGASSQTKRPTSCVQIVITGEFELQSKYDDAVKEVKALMPVWN